MQTQLQKLWNDFAGLFYPNLCVACIEKTPVPRHILCVSCLADLPQTYFHQEKDNAFEERFWGRVPIQAGTAMFYFVKEGRTQNMIHGLKYKGLFEIGVRLGNWYGKKLLENETYQSIDCIVPVPLHPRKKQLRGYNQSDAFAKGLSESMHRPWYANALKRVVHSASQTQKTRAERLHNVKNVFEVGMPTLLRGKHVLLVDDVLTTGATLETCANILLQKTLNTKVSLATIAIAKH